MDLSRLGSRVGERRAALLALACALALAAGLLGGCGRPNSGASAPRVAQEAVAATAPVSAASGAAESTATMVEVPKLTGTSLDEARTILGVAGLTLVTEETSPSSVTTAPTVIEQDPQAGSVVRSGTVVTVVVPASPKKAATKAPKRGGWVVCLDPGHQAHSDTKPEPIGPGARATRPRATGGVTGVSLGVPESEIVLQVSMNLKERLEAAGITVVMTRTTNDVDLSNGERAAIANAAHANLLVRVHADASANAEESGVRTFFPGPNGWTAPISPASKRAAQAVQGALLQSTHAVDRGVVEHGDVTCFNWSKVPAISVQCGLLSNPVEDKLLTSPHYQDKVAEGMAAGIIAFLDERE